MPSVSKKQAHLFAAALHNPALAKKRGIPLRVARDFHRADKRTGILKKAAGGSALQSGMDGQQNFGQGRGHSMFSKMPLMGHAMSGTQLGQADALIRKSQARFADGGAVKKDSKAAKPQMSGKERREVRALIERGKKDAVASLREARNMLLDKAPAPSSTSNDVDASLAQLSQRLATRSPDALYRDYRRLMSALESGDDDPKRMMKIVDQLAEVETALNQLGIQVEAPT